MVYIYNTRTVDALPLGVFFSLDNVGDRMKEDSVE